MTFNQLLRSGETQSCGCLNREIVTTHGQAKTGGRTKVYNAWCSIKARCYRESTIGYHNYGGRGITMCDRWLNSFEAFFSDVGEPPSPQHSIGRIDNNGNYEPGNVRWETKLEQDANRRQSRFYTVNGVTGCLKQLAERFGLHHNTVGHRLNVGWSVQDAFTKPAGKGGRPRRFQPKTP